jgi:hypothetical protein
MDLPNTDIPTTPADYKPVTLLNPDYKIVARIIVNRLRPTFSNILHTSQYFGVPGNMIFDAVASVRDVIAYAELTHVPLCILSLEFTAAFDRISHAKELFFHQHLVHKFTYKLFHTLSYLISSNEIIVI